MYVCVFCFRPKSVEIADFGCGDARLAESLPQHKVYSFDLVATKPCITVCDIAKVGLGGYCMFIFILVTM